MIGRVLGLAAAVLAAAMLAMPAAAYSPSYSSTPVLGGNGGGSFDGYCARSEVMTGIGGRTGAWLDAVAPMCSGYGHGPGFDPPRPGPQAGGGGGGPAAQYCPRNSAVRGWEIGRIRHDAGFLAMYVRLICLSLDTASESVTGRFGGGAPVAAGDVMTYRCPRGQVAVGIYGGSGAFVDSLGLHCDTPSLIFGRPTLR